MIYKPHTAIVATYTPDDPDNIGEAGDWSGTVSVDGMLTTKTATEVSELFNVITEEPFLWMFGVEDFEKIVKGCQLTIDTVNYLVISAVEYASALPETNHCRCALEKLHG